MWVFSVSGVMNSGKDACMSTPCKLKSLLDRSGNQTRNLWFASLTERFDLVAQLVELLIVADF